MKNKIITIGIIMLLTLTIIGSVSAIGDVNVELGGEITSALGGLTDFTSRVGENISITFRQMANFLKFFQIIFYNLYFFIVFALFILVLAAVFYLPVKLHPIYMEWKNIYAKQLGLLLHKKAK